MSKELTVSIDGKDRKVFLQTGFYSHTRYKSLEFHRHSYPEVHIFLRCDAKFITAEGTYSVKDGDVLMVPGEMFHAYQMGEEEGSLHFTFQIDAPCNEVVIRKLPNGLASDLLSRASELKENDITADHSSVVPHLAFIGTALISDREHRAREITDYPFLMREYMEYNYAKNITLEDLAKHLRISKKQTERLAIKYFGRTFLEELTAIRMNAANILLRIHGKRNLTEIATLVGYQSYSGFFKAYKKYRAKCETSENEETDSAKS